MDTLLPIKHPLEYNPADEDPLYFYNNVTKPLIEPFIRLMQTGLTIDDNAVEDLRTTIDTVLTSVEERLAVNPIIVAYQKIAYSTNKTKLIAEQKSKFRTIDHYIKEYKQGDMLHRTTLVNYLLKANNKPKDIREKWSANDLKKYRTVYDHPLFTTILDKSVDTLDVDVLSAMQELANAKLVIYNKSKMEKVDNATVADLAPPFKPNSTTQKRKLFEHLKIAPLKFSKETGEASWNRDVIDELKLTTPREQTDMHDLLQAFIDFSFAGIIRSNFLEAFDTFTIDGVLKGNLKLLGAKSARPTSNSPNLLNAPSTGSIYSKPLKKCFVAPTGYRIWSIDYSALEDRIMANLSKDDNKIAVFSEGIDGHSLGATYYFKAEVEGLLGHSITDHKAAAKELKGLVSDGNSTAKEIRQRGKPVTFGLSYGAYPKKVAESIKCSLEEATGIFEAYHNEMYPGITKFRNEVIERATFNGYNHLGLGCLLYSSDVKKEERTIWNASSQFWSILTLMAMADLYEEIDTHKRNDDVFINATIYDAIYGYVRDDAESIKWLNDTICPIMETDFLENQIVHNEANLEISDLQNNTWASIHELKHDMSVDEITKFMEKIDNEEK